MQHKKSTTGKMVPNEKSTMWKKIQHKKRTRVKHGKKSAQESCIGVLKWITGRPLTDRYTLVKGR